MFYSIDIFFQTLTILDHVPSTGLLLVKLGHIGLLDARPYFKPSEYVVSHLILITL